MRTHCNIHIIQHTHIQSRTRSEKMRKAVESTLKFYNFNIKNDDDFSKNNDNSKNNNDYINDNEYSNNNRDEK